MRVSHLAAVATLVALLGAMFIAMGSASAAGLGPCNANPDITLGFGDSCTIEVKKLDDKADNTPATVPTAGAEIVTGASVSGGVLTIQAGSVVVRPR